MHKPTSYSYVRISEKDQSRYSLAAQKELCQEYYQLKLAGTHQDGGVYVDNGVRASVAFSKRPAGQELDCRLQRNDAIILPFISRGFRDTDDMGSCFCRWKQMNVILHTLHPIQIDTSTSIGKFMIYVLCIGSEMEADMKRERIRSIIKHRIAATDFKKRPDQYRQLGKRWVKDENKKWIMEDDPEERTTMGLIYDMYQQGETFHAIKMKLEKADIRNYSGRLWSLSAIHRAYHKEKGIRDEQVNS